MNFRDKQIAPPKSWIAFEDLCLALFKGILSDPLAKKHGRTGQAQSGVDVYGRQGGVGSAWSGIQCKGKEQGYGAVATEAEFKAELEKAERFTPTLTRWIFATTAPSDAKLQQVCRRIADERRSAGKFDVDLLSWDDLQQLIAADSSVLRDSKLCQSDSAASAHRRTALLPPLHPRQSETRSGRLSRSADSEISPLL
jgi:hypothetical protein